MRKSANPISAAKPKARGMYDKKGLYELLPRHTEFTPDLLRRIQQLPITILENKAHPDARLAYRLAREVGKDFERGRQFTRTQLNEYGVLFGIVMLKYRTNDMLLNYFHTRFPAFVIVLFNKLKQECYISTTMGEFLIEKGDLDSTVAKWSKNRPIDPQFSKLASEPTDRSLFEEFYKSQFIDERENPRYFHHMIPKEVMQWPGMEIENGFRNNKLDKFLNSSNKKN